MVPEHLEAVRYNPADPQAMRAAEEGWTNRTPHLRPMERADLLYRWRLGGLDLVVLKPKSTPAKK